jgi:hypothetical protein
MFYKRNFLALSIISAEFMPNHAERFCIKTARLDKQTLKCSRAAVRIRIDNRFPAQALHI